MSAVVLEMVERVRYGHQLQRRNVKMLQLHISTLELMALTNALEHFQHRCSGGSPTRAG